MPDDPQTPQDGETLLEVGGVVNRPSETPTEVGSMSIYNDSELQQTLLDCGPGSDSNVETRKVQAPHGAIGGKRYEVRGEIGRGGMGVVLRAFDRDLKRDVALKITRSDRTGSHSVGRFIDEAQITGQLNHPGVVPVHELGHEPGGRTFFTMKLVEGRSLAQILRQLKAGDEEARERFPLSRRLYIFGQLLNCMAYAHDHGVIHRDLKPDNVMVGDYGEVMVMDWGLAKVRDRPDLADKVTTSRMQTPGGETLDGVVMGTPAYMSPEQARGERDNINERSDIYSLGAILYEMLALAPPYEAATASELIRMVANEPPPPPSAKVTGGVITRGLERIVMRCLDPAPAARFASLRDLQTAMNDYGRRMEDAAGEGTTFALLGKLYVLLTAAAMFVFTAWFTSGSEAISLRKHLLDPGLMSALITMGIGLSIEWLVLGPRWAWDATDAGLLFKHEKMHGDGLRGHFALELARRAKWFYVLPCLVALAYAAWSGAEASLVIACQLLLAGVMCVVGAMVPEQAGYRRLDAMDEVAPQDRRDAPLRWGVVALVLALAVINMHHAGWDFRPRSLEAGWSRGILGLHIVAVLAGVWAIAVVTHPVAEVNHALRRLLFGRIKPHERERLAPMARLMATGAALFGCVGALTWISLHAPTIGQPDGARATHFAMGLTCLWAGLIWSWWFRWRARVVNVLKTHESNILARYALYRATRTPKAEGFFGYLLVWSPFVIGGWISAGVLIWRALAA
ncbi:MAG: serine/threonine protein kinase [Planctomycetes bacterium]|nr:serine/threonine protein kinase [Planctomycetota bacterium]MCW8135968.1 serine/threonine protein kinase [Planctomycetota bacterium]